MDGVDDSTGLVIDGLEIIGEWETGIEGLGIDEDILF